VTASSRLRDSSRNQSPRGKRLKTTTIGRLAAQAEHWPENHHTSFKDIFALFS
jgi:hypothetical protein